VRRNECPREPALLDALRSGAWPDDIPHDLRGHVERCASCAALAGLVGSLLEDHRTLVNDAAVPSSSFMWWRLQLRARREAAELAMRPITAAQGLALAGAVGLMGALFATFAPRPGWLAAWLGSLGRSAAAAGTDSLASALGQWLSPAGISLMMTGALVLVVAPVAIYFALSDR
jgi:hypothetical protein